MPVQPITRRVLPSPHACRPLRFARPPVLVVVLLLAAGCGSMGSQAPGNKQLQIQAATATIDTNSTDQFTATFPSGSPKAVKWSIVEGENDASAGQGTINIHGFYTPPPLLSQSPVKVRIQATSEADPALYATYVLTVTPGFVHPLKPEDASLAPRGALRVTGEIAAINSGAIRWSLASSPGGEENLGAAYGKLTSAGCKFSSRAYTSCTVTYTAPASSPKNTSVYLVGSAPGNPRTISSVHILLNGSGFNSSALENQSAQTEPVEMGSSGGNANDYDSSQNADGKKYVNDCCGGTLGALVRDRNDNLYILSNNHVLAESDQARLGDTIIEPALIDLNCNPQAGRAVGALRYVAPLESTQTNVDAALAAATPAVDPSGSILQLGNADGGRLSAAAPAAGDGEALNAGLLNHLRVVKSGRTTGLTCSTVGAVDLTVQVDYYYDCAETQPFYTKTYTNQIGIPGGGFADSGDSGALVLDAGNAEPIGLLFSSGGGAADGGFSVANPIQDVLSELGDKSISGGEQFQIVGGARHPITCSNYDANQHVPAPPIDPAQLANAKLQAESAAATLMRPGNGLLGTNAGNSLDHPGQAAVIFYVDSSKPNFVIPETFGGFPTRVIVTDTDGASAGVLPPDHLQGIHLPANLLRSAAAVQRQYAPQLMRDPAFFGVGVTQSHDNPADAALLVLVDPTKTPASTPDLVGGLRVRYMKIGRLHVTRSKHESASKRPTSCQLRAKSR